MFPVSQAAKGRGQRGGYLPSSYGTELAERQALEEEGEAVMPIGGACLQVKNGKVVEVGGWHVWQRIRDEETETKEGREKVKPRYRLRNPLDFPGRNT